MKHTPEPWEVSTVVPGAIVSSFKQEENLLGTDKEGYAIVMKLEDANRIVQCVNACAGMEDPAKKIATLKQQRDILLNAIATAMDANTENGYKAMVHAMKIIPVNENTRQAHVIWDAYVKVKESP